MKSVREVRGLNNYLTRGDYMGIIRGTVKGKSATKFGHGINVNDKWYNSKYPIPCEKGDEVEFDDGDKNYANKVKVVVPASGGGSKGSSATSSTGAARTSSASASGGYRGVFPIPANDGARSIVRQNSVTNAVNLLKDFAVAGADIDTLVVKVLDIARTFERYSAGDIDAEIEKELDSTFEVK